MGCSTSDLGSKAALTAPKSNFRFTPESGLRSDIAPCPKSANSGHPPYRHNAADPRFYEFESQGFESLRARHSSPSACSLSELLRVLLRQRRSWVRISLAQVPTVRLTLSPYLTYLVPLIGFASGVFRENAQVVRPEGDARASYREDIQ